MQHCLDDSWCQHVPGIIIIWVVELSDCKIPHNQFEGFYQGLKMKFTPVPHLFIEKLSCRGLRLMENCSVATRRRENLFLYLRCSCDTSKIHNRNLSSTIHWPTMKLRIAFAPGILFLYATTQRENDRCFPSIT